MTSRYEDQAGDPPRRDVRRLRKLGPFLRPYRWQIAGALLALTVAGLTVLALGQGLRRLIDDGLTQGDPALLNGALVALLAVSLALAAATYSRFYLVSWIGERVAADLRRAVYSHVLSLSPGFFEVTRTGELMSRLTTDTTLLQTIVGSSASMALRNVLLLVGGTVMLAVTSAKLTGLIILIVPIVVVPIIVIGRRVRRLSRLSQDGLADVSAYVDESIAHIRTVQAFGHEEVDRIRFADQVERAFHVAVRRIRVRAFLTALVVILVFGGVAVVLWMGGRDMLAGDMSPGQLSAFLFYAVVVAGSVGALSEVVGDLQRAAGATERLIELLATESDIPTAKRPTVLPTQVAGTVAFQDVSFRYPARQERAALNSFTLTVDAGERVALVGASGAGKSTVFQLLLRFYDPEAGVIRLDGIDIRDLAPTDLRSQIALVSQDPVIFSTSAAENIRYGRPDATDAEVRSAAETAVISDFLEGLPDGFNTFLGQKGVRLSGGQRQRVAIARAVLRNPRILLLDEATSALDSESERAVQSALERLMAGRTTIAIAHRLATVREADRIVVLDGGKIVAQGRHDALMAQGGLYARLATMQFENGATPVGAVTSASV